MTIRWKIEHEDREPVAPAGQTIDQFVVTATAAHAKIIEDRIRIALRPRPSWMTERLWRWMVSQLIAVEIQRGEPEIPAKTQI